MTVRQQHPRNSTGGFTLIEALVATVLTAIILAALATITAQWMPNWNRGISRLQSDEDLALGLDRIVADLSSAEFIPAGDQTRAPLFSGSSRSVTFVRTSLSPNAAPGLEIVRFAEITSTDEPKLVRTEAPFETDGINRDASHFGDSVVLVRVPYQISFSYAGPDRVWRDSWEQERLLPRAVRLTVHDAKTQQALTVSTATLLHIETPLDCLTAKILANCLAEHQQPTGRSAGTASVN
jgi:general secretion pathway protein J